MSGIYIHIPFCKQACHYCDFHFSTSLSKKEVLLVALQKELILRKSEFTNEVVETIYFGGGTPSILNTSEINALIRAVYDNYDVIEDPEITLEANPDDLSISKLKELAQSSINRLSIGIQSFFEEDLKLMNRAHNALEAEACLEMATAYFANISIDLIYGMPNMSSERWLQNIEKALSYGIPHISSYALTVEPKTALANFIAKGKLNPLDDGQAQSHFQVLYQKLTSSGFDCYEVSNFGKPGYYSKNNTAYWLGKKYIGVGPSAHSYNGKQRSWNIANNPKYIRAIENGELLAEVEVLTLNDRYNEYIMTSLRTSWGVSLQYVSEEFGADFKEYLLAEAQEFIERRTLVLSDGQLIRSKSGIFLADGIASALFMVNLDE